MFGDAGVWVEGRAAPFPVFVTTLACLHPPCVPTCMLRLALPAGECAARTPPRASYLDSGVLSVVVMPSSPRPPPPPRLSPLAGQHAPWSQSTPGGECRLMDAALGAAHVDLCPPSAIGAVLSWHSLAPLSRVFVCCASPAFRMSRTLGRCVSLSRSRRWWWWCWSGVWRRSGWR
jgi:hypothetical protein